MATAMPLPRARAHNTLRQLESELSPAVKKLADQLLALLDEQGFASVKTVHDALFPMAETTSAAAQLSTLGKKIEDTAKARRMTLKLSFKGAKNAGVAQRKVYFSAPRVKPVADTEGIDAIAPTQRIQGQLTLPLDAPRILLLTFNDNEFAGVRKQFWQGPNDPPSLGTGAEVVDDLGALNGWHVLHGHSRQGNREAQRNADTLRRAHTPFAIVAVGIAFGINEKDQRLGDVLVSKFIVDYEKVKITADEVSFRDGRPNASRPLIHGLEQLATRQLAKPFAGWPRLQFGGVLTGEKLVDDLAFRNQLVASAHQGGLIGGEMEAVGLFTALDDTDTRWVVIKAICDFGDGHKSVNKEQRQKDAAANSALVVHTLLLSPFLAKPKPANGDSDGASTAASSKVPLHSRHRAPDKNEPEHDRYVTGQHTHAVSLENIRDADAIEKPEAPKTVAFDHILQWLADPSAPPLYALLGEYGMGKTTHCQTLAKHLDEQRDAGAPVPTPLYFDLRKVERIAAKNDNSNTLGHVATLEEAIQDCLRNGYLQVSGYTHTYQDVLDVIDQGAFIIFDGLDEVLSRIGDAQGLKFTANLLKVLPEASHRQAAMGRKPDEMRLPKVLISCRTQFFRNLAEQNSHLTGEHRGGQTASQYRASVLQPFTDAQIERYVQAVFPDQDVAALMAQIASVHNLRELAGRPFTLKLVAQFVPRIQSWIKQGRTITGATLYREVAREWLLRDKEKQSFQPEDKERLACDLAAHLWKSGQRGLRARELETWLDDWLDGLPKNASVLQKPRDLLYQDLRNATFLKRSDADKPENSRFEFAHTSLQEFFLADYLFRALQTKGSTPPDRSTWAMPLPSGETLDFLGQILAETGTQSTELQMLSNWRKLYLAQASELQLAYAQRAFQKGWPLPITSGSDLQGADLSNWHFGSADEPGVRAADISSAPTPLLDLTHCNFAHARLRESRFWGVRLNNANFTGAAMTQAELLRCNLSHAVWGDADTAGALFHPAAIGGTEFADGALTGLALHFSTGHGSSVSGCVFSPLGHLVLSGSDDSTLKLWDAASGDCLRTFTGHGSSVESCAFSPLSDRVLSCSGDGTLKLWDATTGDCLRTFTGHGGSVRFCVFSPLGDRVLSGSEDSTLKLWDTASGECLLTFTGHGGSVWCCAFSPLGDRVLSGSEDSTLKLWDTTSGECLRTFTGNVTSVWSCAFSHQGDRVLSGAYDSTLKLWDASTGECLLTFNERMDSVWSCAFSPQDDRVLSGSDDCTLKLWDATTGECLLTFNGHAEGAWCCAFSPQGDRVLSGSGDSTLKLWDTASGECLRTFTGHDNSMMSCAISPLGDRVLSSLDDGTLKLWDTTKGECLRTFTEHGDLLVSYAFSPRGDRVLSASDDDTLTLWNITTGERLRTFAGHAGFVMSCTLSPQGDRVLSASDDKTLKLWDATTGECLRTFNGHGGSVMSCAFSPLGDWVLSASDDKTLKLWDATTGEYLRTFNGHGGSVLSCAFSPLGDWVLSASDDETLKLWDAATGECLRTFTGHGDAVRSCAFSAQGDKVLSGSIDGTLKLWDAASGECLHTFAGHGGPVPSCAFSPQGDRVLSGANDGTLKLWDAASGECLQTMLDVPQGSAAWTGDGKKLLHASGRAWRYLRWRGVDTAGNTRLYPLESRPEGVVTPWLYG